MNEEVRGDYRFESEGLAEAVPKVTKSSAPFGRSLSSGGALS